MDHITTLKWLIITVLGCLWALEGKRVFLKKMIDMFTDPLKLLLESI